MGALAVVKYFSFFLCGAGGSQDRPPGKCYISSILDKVGFSLFFVCLIDLTTGILFGIAVCFPKQSEEKTLQVRP